MHNSKTLFAAVLAAFLLGAAGMWLYTDRQSDPFGDFDNVAEDVFDDPFFNTPDLKDPFNSGPFGGSGVFDQFSPLLNFEPGLQTLRSNWPRVSGLALSAGEDKTHYFYRLPIEGKTVSNVDVKTENNEIRITAELQETRDGAVRKVSLAQQFPLPADADEKSLQVTSDEQHITITLTKRGHS